MRHLKFLFLVMLLPCEGLADQSNVRAFESVTFSFIEIPDLDPDTNFPARWLIIDHASGRCKLADGSNVNIASGRMSLNGNVIVGNWYRP
jgi:hypothetical protein